MRASIGTRGDLENNFKKHNVTIQEVEELLAMMNASDDASDIIGDLILNI